MKKLFEVCKRKHDLSKTRYFKDGKSRGCYECLKITTRAAYLLDDSKRRARRLKWKTEHPEAHALSRWRSFLKKRYGISLEAYDTMLARQHGRCATCGNKPTHATRRGLHMDHNHTTGVTRGLLCNRCNVVIGSIGEDPMLAYRIATYLERYRLKLVS